MPERSASTRIAKPTPWRGPPGAKLTTTEYRSRAWWQRLWDRAVERQRTVVRNRRGIAGRLERATATAKADLARRSVIQQQHTLADILTERAGRSPSPPSRSAIPAAAKCWPMVVKTAVNGRSFHGILARRYAAAGPSNGYLWKSDILQDRLGYCLIGSAQATNLWRIARVEVDYARRYNFALIPVRLAHGLPHRISPRLRTRPSSRKSSGNGLTSRAQLCVTVGMAS
jgi:hypothetical protein